MKGDTNMPSYHHEWQCMYCGKIVKKITSDPNPPTPFVSSYCKSNPFGNKKAKCVLQKIR